MKKIISRRFGDISALQYAYSVCVTDVHARLLLRDLSPGGSNLSDRDVENDDDEMEEKVSVTYEMFFVHCFYYFSPLIYFVQFCFVLSCFVLSCLVFFFFFF